MPIKWILFVEKKEATDFDKFIKLISHEHWRVAEKISSTAANFETETGDVNVEHKLEHIFAHQDWNKDDWEQILLTREDPSSAQKPITLNLLENERFISQFSPEQVFAEGILKLIKPSRNMFREDSYEPPPK